MAFCVSDRILSEWPNVHQSSERLSMPIRSSSSCSNCACPVRRLRWPSRRRPVEVPPREPGTWGRCAFSRSLVRAGRDGGELDGMTFDGHCCNKEMGSFLTDSVEHRSARTFTSLLPGPASAPQPLPQGALACQGCAPSRRKPVRL